MLRGLAGAGIRGVVVGRVEAGLTPEVAFGSWTVAPAGSAAARSARASASRSRAVLAATSATAASKPAAVREDGAPMPLTLRRY
ncbi:MAG: hypothetical protein C4343_03300 [Chloroflexota bacterium]